MRWRSFAALTSLMLFAAHPALAAGRPCIVEDGQPNARIVIATNAIRVVELAAEQLQEYIARMSGALLNLCRARLRDAGVEASAFSPTGEKGFHHVMKFGKLTFRPKPVRK